MRPSLSLKEKIEAFSIPEPNSGCWLWTRALRNKWGYGAIGKNNYAHRIAWREYKGPIPLGMCVLHRCDTPSCVNPEHLFLGSKKDNTADCIKKGRKFIMKGEANPCAALSNKDIIAIRASQATGVELSKAYKVSMATISEIRSRKKWSHI